MVSEENTVLSDQTGISAGISQPPLEQSPHYLNKLELHPYSDHLYLISKNSI